MPSIDKFCEWMRVACEDWSVGYDQSNRWDVRDGGETDCSALVIWALRKAGFDTGSASYTGDMSSNLTARGWKRIRFTSVAQVRKGDILLNDLYHTCAVISGSGATAKIAQASIDENGRATGGRAGDQTGYETNIKTVYVYSHGWDCILRYEGAEDTKMIEVTGVVDKATVTKWQRQMGTVVDGVISGQLEECRGSFPAFKSVTFEGDGSSLMMAVQKKVGVPNPTGVISSGTVCMIQGWLVLNGYSCAADHAGRFETATAKALQQSLNDGKWSQ